MTAGRILTGVSGSFTATHVCVEGEPHPHIWHVEAWFQTAPRADARCTRAALDMLLATWEDTALPAEIDWREDIAYAISRLVNCVEVVVRRPDERIHARWVA